MAYGVHPQSKRAPLSRESVLAAATELAAAEGLTAISMRRLADHLGVVPMALYKHVSNKDDLVAGMIDVVVASFPQPTGSGWRLRVRERVLGARSALAAKPWLRPALESATVRTPTVLAHMNAVAGEFISGGLSVDLVHYLMHALGYRIWGFNPEAFAGAPTPEPLPPEAQAEQFAMMQRHFPHIAAIAHDAVTRNPEGACDDNAEFTFGLDLLLDAAEQLHATGWTSRS